MSASEAPRLALVAVLALAACTPPAVSIREETPYRFVAAATRDGMPGCLADAKRRALREAKSYCEAKGRAARIQDSQGEGDDRRGCRFEVAFACAMPR